VIIQARRRKFRREFLREFLRGLRAGETNEQVIASDIVLMRQDGYLNAAVVVKGMHRVQPLPEAAGRHGNFYDIRKIAGDGLLTAGHFCSGVKVGDDNVRAPPYDRIY
jgi:hypothetical protein